MGQLMKARCLSLSWEAPSQIRVSRYHLHLHQHLSQGHCQSRNLRVDPYDDPNRRPAIAA